MSLLKLFSDEEIFGKDTSELSDPEITQVVFYFGKKDADLFKALAKEGMKVEFKDFINDGNISELLLKLLKRNYENLLPQKVLDRLASGTDLKDEVPGGE